MRYLELPMIKGITMTAKRDPWSTEGAACNAYKATFVWQSMLPRCSGCRRLLALDAGLNASL